MMDVTQAEATRTFAKIGFLSFGGPAAQISVMHRILVDEKKWLSEAQFLHALNFCMLLPGPEAMQLATYAGWLLHGVRGGLIAGLLFIAPGLIMMLGLSALYVHAGDIGWVAGLLFGLKAAVLAVVLEALLRVSRRALGSHVMYLVALGALIAIAFFQVPFPLVVLVAALTGAALWRFAPGALPRKTVGTQSTVQTSGRQAMRQSLTQLLIWGALWLVPLLAIALVWHDQIAQQMALFFSKTALVTFGGAYAVLTYVAQQAVDTYGWLTTQDMVAGLGLAETTLGPLVLVLVFVGFVGGGGLVGGLIAAWFTFVPCFLWIFVGAPHMERLRHVQWLSASLAAITAAVVGVIANLALWFGLAVLFGKMVRVDFGWLHYWWPQSLTPDWVALAIAISSAALLLRMHINMLVVLALAALAGLLAALAGWPVA